MKVRLDSPWMQHLDERILEYIAAEGAAPVWMLASDLHHEHGHVRRRCRTLAEAEFVQVERREGNADLWDVTTWGLLYLAGELDADHRRPIPAVRPSGRIRPGWYAGFG